MLSNIGNENPCVCNLTYHNIIMRCVSVKGKAMGAKKRKIYRIVIFDSKLSLYVTYVQSYSDIRILRLSPCDYLLNNLLYYIMTIFPISQSQFQY